MTTVNTSTYKTNTMEQITVSSVDSHRRVLMTRFNGSRLWAVRGSFGDDFNVVLHDGIRRQSFLRGTAMELAELFVRTGREFL